MLKVEYHQYYDGLSEQELVHNDNWLIVCTEAAWHCGSRHEDYVRYNQLKTKCNEVLNLITKGARSDFGGSFDSIINSRRYEKFWDVVRVNKNETRIYPNIPAIQNEVRCRKLENLNSGNKRLIRIINNFDTVHCNRSIIETPAVSDRLDVVVTRANPKK